MSTLQKPKYYECGICGQIHPWGFDGDCRDDVNRFNLEDLETRHGVDGFELVEWSERLNSEAGQ
jgi:hypothetical protein